MHFPAGRLRSKLACVAILGVAFMCITPVSAGSDRAAIMRDVYDAIAYLLPLSLRDPADRSVWDRGLIEEKVSQLENAAQTLNIHMSGAEKESEQIARSFEQSVSGIGRTFSNEWPEFAYFSMMDLVQHCVACHSRIEAPSQALFGQRLIARMDTREMPEGDVVRLFIAVRQFDAALKSLDKILMDPNLHPIEADYASHMVDYLQVALGTMREPDRVTKFLNRYKARGDLPFYLLRRVDTWLEAVAEFGSAVTSNPDFDVAKSIFYGADKLSRGPGDRLRAAHDVIAATIIRAYLEDRANTSSSNLSEAYYILGVVALRTLEPKLAVPEMELLFASSIRADPKSAYAEEAYALLEEYGYVHEDHLADEVVEQTLIDMPALRKLMQQ